MFRLPLWLTALAALLLAACALNRDVTRLNPEDISRIRLIGPDVASAERIGPTGGGVGVVEFSDRHTIAQFAEAFHHKDQPKAVAMDKANTVEFYLKGQEEPLKFEFGPNSLMVEDGPEVATVLRPFLKKD